MEGQRFRGAERLFASRPTTGARTYRARAAGLLQRAPPTGFATANGTGQPGGIEMSTSWRDGVGGASWRIAYGEHSLHRRPARFSPVSDKETLMRSLRTFLAFLAVAGALACGQTPVTSDRTAPDPRMDGGPYLGGGNAVDSTTTPENRSAGGPYLGGGN